MLTALQEVRSACEKAGCSAALESIIAMYEVQLEVLRSDLLDLRKQRDDMNWRFVNPLPPPENHRHR